LCHAPGIDIDPYRHQECMARWAVEALRAYREQGPY
jgi:hypothetical protein